MLLVRGLCKRFGGRQVLSVREFAVGRGECALVYGANGGGKTTLLKILAGLLLPDAADEWQLDGRKQLPSQHGILGAALLHQTPFMLSATVRDNVAFVAPAARIDAALEWAGLSAMAQLSARDLSGGERGRVSLARARAMLPTLCLMDEPAAHLDATGLSLIGDLTTILCRQGGAVVISAPDKSDNQCHQTAWELKDGDLCKQLIVN